ncbi:MAG: ATP-binding cassette domain-containing protein [Oscillospiraceae bacterium]|jgi:branched-chain amino acid transport system ATP-binding protein|nr:ATP-binding cassette domain-containing protein [Oscillospiraceae bacterium]
MFLLEKLCVNYGGIKAARNVSLSLKKGACAGLAGANGAGKSTALSAAAGLISPSSGRIIFKGQEINGLPAAGRVQLGLVMVPEGRRVFPMMSVRENLLAGAYTRPGKSKPALAEIYEKFPLLKKKAGMRAGALSGGEQQILAVGRALMANPELLILDEPTMGLSPKMAAEIFEILGGLKKMGTSMLIASQETRRLETFCDFCALMRNGEIFGTHGAI